MGLFSNQWWRRYGGVAQAAPSQTPALPVSSSRVVTPFEGIEKVSVHRADSFVRLFRTNNPSRQLFREQFLEEIFNVMPSAKLFSTIMSCCYDVRCNGSDAEIYDALSAKVKGEHNGAVAQFFFLLANIKQLAAQRAELTREVVSVVSKLGRIGTIHDYCSIGDHGKLVLSLKRALKMGGRMVVANDTEGQSEDIPCVLERCSVDPVGQFVRVDFSNLLPREFPSLDADSFDLVTMNQGLHHLKPQQIPYFLDGVARILRAGGLFIVREHDMADESLRPVLDCAHSVFNACTGVSTLNERQEIRGFRSLLEWRALIEGSGHFIDTLVYEMQPHDCTKDVMMVFKKTGEIVPREMPEVLPVKDAANRVAAALPKVKGEGRGSLFLFWSPHSHFF